MKGLDQPLPIPEEHRPLADAIAASGPSPDLGYLALVIAARHYADLNLPLYTARLNGLADRASGYLGSTRSPGRCIDAVNRALFEDEGFYGNVDAYYEPRNSFLNEVLDRGAGIPITLSILYLAIARRLELPMEGVGLPLHFIVKYAAPGGDIFVDPFNRGQVLTRHECQELVESAQGAPVHLEEMHLAALPARDILFRMLNNLKFIYLRAGDLGRAATVVEQMLVVRPDHNEQVRDRGLIALKQRRWKPATHLLERYLHRAPTAPDAERVRGYLAEAYNRLALRN